MKYYQIIFFLFLSINAKSQDMIHWIINPDAKVNCSFIKSGKFVNEETGDKITEGYTIEFRGSVVTEKMENGKFYIKSKVKYTSECSYELYVLETNEPRHKKLIGTTYFLEILETSKVDKLVRISSKDGQIFVLRKIKD